MMKSGDFVLDSAWDRVGQLERGTGDLPGWFARGRRELDGARSGEGGAARQGCSTRFAGAGVASLRRCGDVCNGVRGMPKTRLVLWYALRGLVCRAGETSPWRGGAGPPATGVLAPRVGHTL